MKEKSIHSIKELMGDNNFDAFFIIDNDKEKNLTNDAVLYEEYRTKSKRLVSNSLFLYRQPKRLAKNRKFNIYGGGIIDKIEMKDDMYIAHIKDGFELIESIDEDNEHLINMKWTSKIKTNGWDHFWSQYGINEINKEDMLNILEKSYFIYLKEKMMTPGAYNELRDNRFYIRDLVNRLVANLETDKLEFLGIEKGSKVKIMKRAEKFEKGYDILSYDEYGNEIHIEIKIAPHGQRRLTHVSRRELEMFNDPMFRLYTIYNLEPNTGEFDLVISKGSEILEEYDFEPIMYSARIKKKI